MSEQSYAVAALVVDGKEPFEEAVTRECPDFPTSYPSGYKVHSSTCAGCRGTGRVVRPDAERLGLLVAAMLGTCERKLKLCWNSSDFVMRTAAGFIPPYVHDGTLPDIVSKLEGAILEAFGGEG